MKRCALVLALSVLVVPAFAELPPSAYIEMQRNAPEHLRIEVLRVEKEAAADNQEIIQATALVIEVFRTATDLQTGDMITIRYTFQPLPPGFVGPSPIPVLNEAVVTVAYLSKPEGEMDYQPAAGGMSFDDF